jgi:Zn-dependent peptidase ImmA (M78 family)
MAIDNNEIEANAFAAEILMPRTFIEKELKKELADIEDDIEVDTVIKSLARTFQVSEQAMEYRLINLGIIDAE